MNKEKLETITKLGISGMFVFKHLTQHHNFSEEEAKRFVVDVSVKLSKIEKEKMNKMIEESFK